MQRFRILPLLLVACFATALLAQAPSSTPKSDPELKKLAVLVGHWTYARDQDKVQSPNARCPLEDALDFHVVQALKVNGLTEKQFEDLVAAGEIKKDFPAVCLDELSYATANPDTNCQIVNGNALSRLSSYLAVAGYLFAVTGDAPTARANIRAIIRYFLDSVPHKCWFQAVKMPPADSPPVVSGKGLTPTQCAQLRANYEACKRQAEQALQKCTVTPWNHNCANTAPTCMLPPC